MTESNEFKKLKSQLRLLRRHLLPAEFSSTGSYNEKQEYRARGYILLAHAEIETYLENRTKEIVYNALRKWQREKKISKTLFCLFACYHSGWSSYSDDKNQILIDYAKNRGNTSQNIEKIIDNASTQFANIIKNNHGIKEENLREILEPSGIDLASLDQTWISDMSSFGVKRGSAAHTSSHGTTATINPKDEYLAIRKLLIGLKNLDEMLNQLLT